MRLSIPEPEWHEDGEVPSLSPEAQAAWNAFFELKEAGVPIDPERFLSRFPGCREEIEPLLFTESLFGTLRQRAARSTTRAGPYRLIREIGRGSSGVVYEAVRDGVTDPCAVKVVDLGPLDSAPDSRARLRLIASSHAAMALEHPNIVKVREHGSDGPQRYFVAMDLVRGQTLASLIAERNSPKRPFEVRQAVEIVSAIAVAVHHAHTKAVVHRDLKPSNVLLEPTGTIRITDFGLARFLDRDSGVTVPGEILGTLCYMAPEQAAADHGAVGPPSDIYALGAIFYELLTGAPPVAPQRWDVTLYKVLHEEPTTPRSLRPDLPVELNTMCQRCLEKRPVDRFYKSADELAKDLDAWLDGKPVRVRSVSAGRRAIRWSNRHPKLTLASLMLLLGMGFAALSYRQQIQAANRAIRDQSMSQARLILLTDHHSGWRNEVARQFASIGADVTDTERRDLGTASLIGLDARSLVSGDTFAQTIGNGVSMTFWNDQLIHTRGAVGTDLPTRFTDPTTGVYRASKVQSLGRVGVTEAGTPVQLGHVAGGTFGLWDLTRDEMRFELSAGLATSSTPYVYESHAGPVMALNQTARFGAAIMETQTDTRHAPVWSLERGQRLALHPLRGGAISLAVSRNGDWLSVGHEDGSVELRALPEGNVHQFEEGGGAVRCLAFGYNPTRSWSDGPDSAQTSEYLAAGLEGGLILVWDVRRRVLVNRCRGSMHWINSLAFSPDRMTLASGGKYDVRLWDIATGRQLLLAIPGPNTTAALAFSSDGKRLAATNAPIHREDKPRTFIWGLASGPEMRTLRGLAAPVARVVCSEDARLVAGLASDWKLAVWNVEEERLLHLLEVPQGTSMDNAALSFDAGGQRLAYSSRKHVTVWDVTTGRLELLRELPEGLTDRIAFSPSGAILLMRYEAAPAKPGAEAKQRRISMLRLRDVVPDPPRLLLEVPDFVVETHRVILCAPDGTVFVAEGYADRPNGRVRVIRAFRAEAEHWLWELEVWKGGGISSHALDATGSLLKVVVPSRSVEGVEAPLEVLVEVGSGRVIGPAPENCDVLGPQGSPYLSRNRIYRRGEQAEVLAIGTELDLTVSSADPKTTEYAGFGLSRSFTYERQFSRDGRRFADGTHDGRVIVCDIARVEDRLREMGLK